MAYTLAIGDRAYSSWSLRGWLMFARFGLPVSIETAAMYTPAFQDLLAGFGAARLVPALRVTGGDGGPDFVVWDTMAIAETLTERHPGIPFWPAAPDLRALARSLAAEMHSGFTALRSACPMNLRRSYRGFATSSEVKADLARIEVLWDVAFTARRDPEPWLFGAPSLADVYFAPVAARIAGYGLSVGAAARAYVALQLADPAFRQWRAMGLADPLVQSGYDLDLPEGAWPGPAPLPAAAAEGTMPVNDRCPFSGLPVKPDSLATVAGTVVGFCNTFCRDKVVADAEAWPQVMALLPQTGS